ncbi:NAD-dependent epimerase/dehydratase family protein [Paenibacillus sedimenti]|uniref:Epimerase n=1 Tax=Paenibacillus sedimenti TaxID=2770274 RepID=A0A926KS53_9BACL|nr:NAD-dependent epimerase/dehydratase family protein [Paenibacillus sedimenti]MBD0383074.1 epimerase [Paenibacillus sedimenti]
MKLLILGGTKFLGRAITEAALEQGHDITLFHRGKHDPSAFPQVEHTIGDRESELARLQGRRWDAVIDTSGYVPRVVSAATQLLKDQVDHYTFISSVSVYEDLRQMNVNESAPVARLEDESTEDVAQHYGALKALCEQAVEAAMPGRTLHIRPGLIVGPFDSSDRFTYWPSRLNRGGEALVPLPKERNLQFIDVRDLASWIVRLVEQKTVGIIHASGSNYSMEELVETCGRATEVKTTCTWVSESFLIAEEVGEWLELPLWIRSDSLVGMFGVDNTKAIASGLTTRPLLETVQDTLKWDQSRPTDAKRKAGMEPTRESELLRRWHDRVL